MTTTRHGGAETLSDLAEELRLLAEAVLERVEPALREAASGERPDWDNCTWCPVCAAAALLRGEHHEVLAAVAAHGTALVTVLREALSGVPVDPVMPDDPPPGGHAHRPDSEPAREGGSRHGATDSADTFSRPEESGRSDFRRPGWTHHDTPPAGSRSTETSDRRAADRARYIGIPVTITS